MSTDSPNDLSTQEQLQDLSLKHESLDREYGVLVLENDEYKKEIEELKQRNSQFMEEITSCKELLESERRTSLFTSHRLSTFDSLNSKNDDLNSQIKEYKQTLKQLESENVSLKNENEKYKLALSNYDQAKQKREEIYKNNLSKSDETIKSLEQERDSLQLIISTQFQMLYNNSDSQLQVDEIEKKQHEPMNSNLPPIDTLEILRIASIASLTGQASIISNQPPPGGARISICNSSINTGFIPRFEQHTSNDAAYDYLYGDGDSASSVFATPTPNSVATPNLTAANSNATEMEFENGMIDCGYNNFFQSRTIPNPKTAPTPLAPPKPGIIRHQKSKSMDDGHNQYSSQYIHNVIKQSIKFRRDSLISYDTDKDKLRIQIDQHLQTIKELRKERKILRQENSEMRKKLNDGFKCSAPWQWFS